MDSLPQTLYYAATENEFTTIVFTGSLPLVDCRERNGGADVRHAGRLLRDVVADWDGASDFLDEIRRIPQVIDDAYFRFFVCAMTSRHPAKRWPHAGADVCLGVQTHALARRSFSVVAVIGDPGRERELVRTTLERAVSVSDDDLELARRILRINLFLFMALAQDPSTESEEDWRVLTPLTDEAIPFCHRPEPHRIATMWLDIRDDERGGRLPISEVIVRSDASDELRERVARVTDAF